MFCVLQVCVQQSVSRSDKCAWFMWRWSTLKTTILCVDIHNRACQSMPCVQPCTRRVNSPGQTLAYKAGRDKALRWTAIACRHAPISERLIAYSKGKVTNSMKLQQSTAQSHGSIVFAKWWVHASHALAEGDRNNSAHQEAEEEIDAWHRPVADSRRPLILNTNLPDSYFEYNYFEASENFWNPKY